MPSGLSKRSRQRLRSIFRAIAWPLIEYLAFPAIQASGIWPPILAVLNATWASAWVMTKGFSNPLVFVIFCCVLASTLYVIQVIWRIVIELRNPPPSSLKILFEHKLPFINTSAPWVFRVGIKNIDDPESISGVKLELQDIRGDASSGLIDLPAFLRPRHAKNDNIDLDPEETKYFDVVEFRSDNIARGARFCLHNLKLSDDIPRGSYKIKLKAFGRNTRPTNCLITITYDGRIFTFCGARIPHE